MFTIIHNLRPFASFLYHRGTLLLWLLALVLIGLYFYFVNVSVFGIMAHEKARESADDLGSTIASLEAEYLVLADRVNLAEAESRGFKEVAQNDIVAVNVDPVAGLSLRGNEN